MAVTTRANVKAYKNVTNTAHDAEIDRLITVVQGFLEALCGCPLTANTAITEYHSFPYSLSGMWTNIAAYRPGRQRLLLKQPPILSVASIYDDPLRVYGSDTLIASSYYVIQDAEIGLIALDGISFLNGLNNVKVTYSGSAFSASELALIEQAAIELIWLARDKGDQNILGLSAKSVGDGNISLLKNDWPASVGNLVDAIRIGHRI